MRARIGLLSAAITVMSLTSSCSQSTAPDCDPPGPSREALPSGAKPAAVGQFPAGVAADYQLGGAYPPPEGVGLVVRDSTASPAPGVYNICYVNAFQTQPGERDLWLRDRRDLILFGPNGRPLVDENWPDELIVDTSTGDKRTRLADTVGSTIRTCATKGFNAVEFDNLDSYSRSKGALTVDDNLMFATALTHIAHEAGLLAGQKNSAELSERGKKEAGFDFALAEECLRFTECADYTATYSDHVIDIEYTDDLPSPLNQVCSQPDRPASTIIRDRKLVPQGTKGYFYKHC